MDNLFEEYKKHRKTYNTRAVDACRSAKHAVSRRWKIALRQWDFDVDAIVSEVTISHRKLWSYELPSGDIIEVLGSYDEDSDPLDGVCVLRELSKYSETHFGQSVLSHEEGRYLIDGQRRRMEAVLDTGGIHADIEYYRKRGYAKQPAFEAAVEDANTAVGWISEEVNSGSPQLFLEIEIRAPDGEVVASSGLSGVSCTREYVLDLLHELFDDVEDSLTE